MGRRSDRREDSRLRPRPDGSVTCCLAHRAWLALLASERGQGVNHSESREASPGDNQLGTQLAPAVSPATGAAQVVTRKQRTARSLWTFAKEEHATHATASPDSDTRGRDRVR